MIRHSVSKLFIIFLIYTLNGYAQVLKNPTKKIDSLLVLVKEKIKSRDTENALIFLDQAKNLVVESDDFLRLKFKYYEADIHVANEDDESALALFLEGYSEIEKKEISLYHSKYAESIGRILSRAKDYDKALIYFRKSEVFALKRKDSITISRANLNIGSVFQMKNQLDSTAFYYDKVLNYCPGYINNDETLATVFSNLIGVAAGKGDFELAEEYGLKSLKIQEIRKDTLKIAGLLSNLGSIKMYNKEYSASNEYYFRAIEMLKGRTDLKSREINAITLFNISQIFYLQGEFEKGYNYLFDTYGLEKGLVNENVENRISKIAAEYEVVEKEKVAAVEKTKRKNAEKWNYVFLTISILLLVFIWLFIRTNKLKRQKNELEFQQEKNEQAREIEKMQSDVQIKILNATLDAKEAERRHISEILHDNVSTLLSSANMHLYAVKTQLKEDTPVEVAKIEMIINETSDKVRDLSHKLISSVLLRFGLQTSVEDLCEKYSNSRIAFKFNSENINRYEENFEIKTHNIIEELMNNIMKHSNAYNASISIKDANGKFFIKILDDGDGFDLKDVNKKDGLGLSQVNARIKVMKGSFEIKSYENTGTQIYIDIPIPK